MPIALPTAFLLLVSLLTPIQAPAQAPSPASSPASNPAPAVSTSSPAAAPKAAEPAPSATVYKSDLGYTFAYPADWEAVDTKPMMPAAKLQAEQNAESDPEKRGAACAQIGLLLRHGNPASVIIAIALPYDCYGSHFAQSDLPAIGSGVAEGMNKNFDMKDPVYSAYKSGTHDLWIERAQASPKEHPEGTYTIETVCGLIDKGMICLMGMAKNDAELKIFEQSQIALESDPPVALVPASAFADAKK